MAAYCSPIEYVPCTDMSNIVDAHLSRLSHNYQNGAVIRGVLTAYLQQALEIEQRTCLLLDNFRLDSAQGQQLNMLGSVLGLARTVCNVARVSNTEVVAADGYYNSRIEENGIRIVLPPNSPLADSNGRYYAPSDIPLEIDLRWPDTGTLTGAAFINEVWMLNNGSVQADDQAYILRELDGDTINYDDARLRAGKVLRLRLSANGYYDLLSDVQLYVKGSFNVCTPGETYRLKDYTFESDSEYRKFLHALTYSYAFDGTLKQYERIVQYLFDDIDFDDTQSIGTSRVLLHGGGIVNIAINRELTEKEAEIIELYKYVLPHFGSYGIEVYTGTDFFRLTATDSETTGLCQPFARSY